MRYLKDWLRHPLVVLAMLTGLAVSGPADASFWDWVNGPATVDRPMNGLVEPAQPGEAGETVHLAVGAGARRERDAVVAALGSSGQLVSRHYTRVEKRVATHVVKQGETLWDIAQKYGVDVDTIAVASNVEDRNALRVGQVLTILPVMGVLHTVRTGDTLWDIARYYGSTVAEIAAASGIANPEKLYPGQQLVVPGAKALEAAKGKSVEARPVPSGSLRGNLLWPVSGTMTSGFERRWGRLHTGIDIAAPTGTLIRAARGGRVVTAGWMGGYGRTVVIDHGRGLVTLYAHCSKILVKKGSQVEKGQGIATVGSSGRSTGPHLHFEVVVDGRPRNPLLYLE